jgi:hypothetical protein
MRAKNYFGNELRNAPVVTPQRLAIDHAAAGSLGNCHHDVIGPEIERSAFLGAVAGAVVRFWE